MPRRDKHGQKNEETEAMGTAFPYPPWWLSSYCVALLSANSWDQMLAAFRWGEMRKRPCPALCEHVKDPPVVKINPKPLTAACLIMKSWFLAIRDPEFNSIHACMLRFSADNFRCSFVRELLYAVVPRQSKSAKKKEL